MGMVKSGFVRIMRGSIGGRQRAPYQARAIAAAQLKPAARSLLNIPPPPPSA
jgi:hypothetical protein